MTTCCFTALWAKTGDNGTKVPSKRYPALEARRALEYPWSILMTLYQLAPSDGLQGGYELTGITYGIGVNQSINQSRLP